MAETEILRHGVISLQLELKAIIHTIQHCRDSMDDLNILNKDGREKINSIRNCITKMKEATIEQVVPSVRLAMEEECKSWEEELRSTMEVFRNVCLSSSLSIQESNRQQLLGDDESQLRHRKKKDKADLLKMSSDVTDRLLSISRTLADSTQNSADTLNSLVTSSGMVDGTRTELDSQGSVISQSGKLLAKYGRREQTDKFLIIMATAFFFACVIYIIQKRLF